MEEKEFSLPDATRVQMVALVQAVIAVVVAFGVPISDQQSVALIALAGVIGTVLIGSDAAIRRERARNADKLRPHARLTQTTVEGGTETVAKVDVPLDAGNADDLNERLAELVRSFETVARFLEAERAPKNGRSRARAASSARR